MGSLRKRAGAGFWVSTVAAMFLALALRAHWFGAPLGNDEGGLTYVAARWHEGGPDLYGHYFIDRPPLLLGLFRIAAETGGASAVRLLGALAAVLLVLIVGLLGREIGTRRTGIWSAALAAVLSSSYLLGAVFTPAELLAALPSAASVLVLLISHRAVRRRHLLLALAGLLAVAALLVKQSFGDAAIAGVAYLFVNWYLERDERRAWVSRAAAWTSGIAAALVGLEAWEIIGNVPDGAMSYALFGFRLDGLSALSGSAGGLSARFADRMVLPMLGSGFAFVLIGSLVGFWVMNGPRWLKVTIGAWAAAGMVGVLLGGSYWSHYLIELIPVASVTAAVALTQWRRILARGAVATTLVAVVAASTIVSSSVASGMPNSQAKTVGNYVARHASRDDTIYVRYAEPNVAYYSGLRDPYPYNWSLMLRTIPGAQRELRSLLSSSHRPTWVVDWEPTTSYGLDVNGRTAALIHRNYELANVVDGVRVLVRRDTKARAGEDPIRREGRGSGTPRNRRKSAA